MTRTATKGFFQIFGVLSLISILTATSQAGILDTTGDELPGWAGSIPYVSASTSLSGTIDYAVFTAANFTANFGGMGYVPLGPLVYTYQVNNTGASFVSTEIVGIVNIAHTIGSFGPLNFLPPDVDATAEFFDGGGNANWVFSPGSIPSGSSSFGLAFSSPQIPMIGAGVTINGGESAFSLGLPTPSPIFIPEPCSMVIIGSGMLWYVTRPREVGSSDDRTTRLWQQVRQFLEHLDKHR